MKLFNFGDTDPFEKDPDPVKYEMAFVAMFCIVVFLVIAFSLYVNLSLWLI